MKTLQTNSAELLEKLRAELKRLKEYFPYRICWGYVDIEEGLIVSASVDKRQMNKAIRNKAIRIVYTI